MSEQTHIAGSEPQTTSGVTSDVQASEVVVPGVSIEVTSAVTSSPVESSPGDDVDPAFAASDDASSVAHKDSSSAASEPTGDVALIPSTTQLDENKTQSAHEPEYKHRTKVITLRLDSEQYAKFLGFVDNEGISITARDLLIEAMTARLSKRGVRPQPADSTISAFNANRSAVQIKLDRMNSDLNDVLNTSRASFELLQSLTSEKQALQAELAKQHEQIGQILSAVFKIRIAVANMNSTVENLPPALVKAVGDLSEVVETQLRASNEQTSRIVGDAVGTLSNALGL